MLFSLGDGFAVIHCDQRGAFWRGIRECFLTASNFGTVIGINRYKSPERYVQEMSMDDGDKLPTVRENYAMRWGIDHEQDGVFEYRLRTDAELSFPGIVVDLGLKLAASPDGFVGEDGILEVKCPVNRRFYDKIPPTHEAQMQGLMGVCRRKWCDHVQWTPTGIKVTRFEFDPEAYREMKGILDDFYDSYAEHFQAKYDAFFSKAENELVLKD